MDIDKLIACHECDLLHQRLLLNQRETAFCQRCGARLYSEKVDMINRSLALNLTALILYLISISLPFLGIVANGIEIKISLSQSISALFEQNMRLMSLVVCLVLLVAPLLRIIGMLSILIPIKINKSPPHSKWAYRVVEWLGPWNMVEVFLIGILVTFVKLAETASIILGISFWAFVSMTFIIIASNISIDRHRLWDQIGNPT